MTTSLQEIREKFEKEYDGCCLGANQAQSDANKKDLADYWLSLIKERDAELVKKIEEVKKNTQMETGSFKYDTIYEECIEIIKKL